ncbi:MAG: Cytochrome c biogenesis protein transmembrane region [Candidatus Amesbacteria bacterium GW2011_GWB1_47_26]|uniref:Cytochrome c biogenesis protein transmembrane region n=1 Tax=Candidatus Amesbacteria bacterium GW2011_GWC2_45_19 TaxID=1618366 RepID=A0A0G1M569_9BACT|nr:MAG: Cytochrome c biogenesis protein transmembrane region [Candidatus Amesbacteria bacterium GW2011_GWC2_45_19]KKU38559.1 MAG: Cytochrome c biogenesis protein transmembrane region [Candidatus Amesbacteria bacterium GW2011_GWA1_46_35]KKU69620.1 MAG: Cytochrome c biogenesis protein transmembrane region [Microgenomates group bacterium GW2011_GWC1_47_20]KKU74613.1 MAG: Cytochrome c biogenesis protein transmembrane region [Candidatus Amesbacteria bacterium GW2011_GWB1_47_26]KKU79593.1 MAG: Cytoch
MNPLIGASVVTSFVAGGAALFAPCCIGVLLPTYLGSVFRQRTMVFFMTFVYFLGLLTVFLPIGLGFSLVSVVLSQYHNLLFSIGAVFMILLGIFLLAGKHFSLPSPVHPQVSKYTIASIFVLGIFSAIATTCCAPVLAGVLAVSTLAGSLTLGGLYTLSYVLGMVFPLFLVAAFLDKTNVIKKLRIFRHSSGLIAGLTFVIFGSYVLYLSLTNQLQMRSDAQFRAILWLAGVNRTVSGLISPATQVLGTVLVVTATLLIIFIAIKQFREGRWKL